MSIAEFLDGMPSFDERNFSRFCPNYDTNKRTPVYISTVDKPSRKIVNDKSNMLLRYLRSDHWAKMLEDEKREVTDTVEEPERSAKRTKYSLTVLNPPANGELNENHENSSAD